jgi:SAM-dependent methyltransferase
MVSSIILTAGILLGSVAFISIVLTVLNYPYASDASADVAVGKSALAYYETAYNGCHASGKSEAFAREEQYVQMARAHAEAAHVPEMISSFLKDCGLEQGCVLEVGAGSGFMQDLVSGYVGIDLSPTAARFFHKPFIQASATALPFHGGAFDGAWSIWVLEHIPNPGTALDEIRRVVKDGGFLLIRPAWNCDPWAADGYEVRPYSDFGWRGKLIKASIPIRLSRWYSLLYTRQVRMLRTLATALTGKPSQLHFVRLKPNYEAYWVTDSDAAVSLDFYELYLWFTSRGDECLNCPSRNTLLFGLPGRRPEALVVRVNKTERRPQKSLA